MSRGLRLVAMLAGVLPFAQQVGIVVLAMFIILGLWYSITGYLGRSTGRGPHGLHLSFLAWNQLGYPVWAFWWGRRLLAGGQVG